MFPALLIVIPAVFAAIVYWDSSKLNKKDPSINPLIPVILVIVFSFAVYFWSNDIYQAYFMNFEDYGKPAIFPGNENLSLAWSWVGIYIIPLFFYSIWSFFKHRKLKLQPVQPSLNHKSSSVSIVWITLLVLVIFLPFIWIMSIIFLPDF